MSSDCKNCGSPVDGTGNCQACLLQLGISHANAKPESKPSMADMPSIEDLNSQFPQLEITRLIGRGGMGAIYHARHTALDREVALKLIAREVAADSSFHDRFEREAKTLARLSHPNIVTVYDCGRTPDGLAYLIMEFVDGINLREAISARSIGPEDALDVVSTICKALEYAHSKGVVHRDIKPENILLGEDGTLKVADFGIAKIVDDSLRSPTLTATRQVLGSLHYLAPEQLEAPEQVDHRVDLYALGVVFYELLTGQLPLGRYEAPSSYYDQIDQRIDAIVLKTLNRKPVHRYQNAAELGSDIHDFRMNSRKTELPLAEPIHERTVSVAFTCAALGGIAEVAGMLHASADHLRAEYRMRDAIWGHVKSKTYVVDMPRDQLQRVEHKIGIFSSSLTIVANSLTTLGSFPNAETGRIVLAIASTDTEQAAELASVLGLPGKQGNRFKHADSPESQGEQARWTLFAVLMLFCGTMNAGAVAIGETIVADTQPFNFLPIALAVGIAVVLGPLSVLQILTGIVSCFGRPRSLAMASSVVSMIPVTPVWLVSLPTGFWANSWLRPVTGTWAAAKANEIPQAGLRPWGATTLMFLRESRWSKLIAAANVAALLVTLSGVLVYRLGYYPVTLNYRVVQNDVNVAAVATAIRERLQDDFGVTTAPTTSQGRAAQVSIRALQNQIRQVTESLTIENTIQLVWIVGVDQVSVANSDANSDENSDANETRPSLGQGNLHSYAIAPGLWMSDRVATSQTALDQKVLVFGNPINLEASLVAKVGLEPRSPHGNGATVDAPNLAHRGDKLRIEFSFKGREQLDSGAPLNSPHVGLGLLIDGFIEGYSPKDSISGKSAVFELAVPANVSQNAIIAAIRGPTIPCELELLD